MFKLISKTIAAVAIVSIALFGSANAKTLKIETHFTASSPNGEVAAQFAKNVEKFSGGSLKVEMFYSSSVTGKSAEVFNSAQTGIIVVIHYQRLLDEIKPNYVHVMSDGQIIKTGESDLALELEKKGYEWTDNFIKET